MKKEFKKVLTNGLLIALSFMVLVGTGYVFAAPTAPPSEGVGVAVPLNLGPEAQTKEGDLTVSGTLTSTTLNVDEICLAGDCQTEWPGGVQEGTISSAAYANISGYSYYYGAYCYSYQYVTMQYYVSGALYNQYNYHCYPSNFSVTMSSGLLPGSTIIEVTNPVVWCHGGPTNYQANGNPTTYISDSYYPYRTQASGVTITDSGDNVIVTGNCNFPRGQYGQAVYMGVRLERADVLYNE